MVDEEITTVFTHPSFKCMIGQLSQFGKVTIIGNWYGPGGSFLPLFGN